MTQFEYSFIPSALITIVIWIILNILLFNIKINIEYLNTLYLFKINPFMISLGLYISSYLIVQNILISNDLIYVGMYLYGLFLTGVYILIHKLIGSKWSIFKAFLWLLSWTALITILFYIEGRDVNIWPLINDLDYFNLISYIKEFDEGLRAFMHDTCYNIFIFIFDCIFIFIPLLGLLDISEFDVQFFSLDPFVKMVDSSDNSNSESDSSSNSGYESEADGRGSSEDHNSQADDADVSSQGNNSEASSAPSEDFDYYDRKPELTSHGRYSHTRLTVNPVSDSPDYERDPELIRHRNNVREARENFMEHQQPERNWEVARIQLRNYVGNNYDWWASSNDVTPASSEYSSSGEPHYPCPLVSDSEPDRASEASFGNDVSRASLEDTKNQTVVSEKDDTTNNSSRKRERSSSPEEASSSKRVKN